MASRRLGLGVGAACFDTAADARVCTERAATAPTAHRACSSSQYTAALRRLWAPCCPPSWLTGPGAGSTMSRKDELPVFLEPPKSGARERDAADVEGATLKKSDRRSKNASRRSRSGKGNGQERGRNSRKEAPSDAQDAPADYRVAYRGCSGEVLWYDTTKRFGFIKPFDGSPDIFVH